MQINLALYETEPLNSHSGKSALAFPSVIYTVKTRVETWRNYEAGELVFGFCSSPFLHPSLSVSVGMGGGKTATQKGQHSLSLAPQQAHLYR